MEPAERLAAVIREGRVHEAMDAALELAARYAPQTLQSLIYDALIHPFLSILENYSAGSKSRIEMAASAMAFCEAVSILHDQIAGRNVHCLIVRVGPLLDDLVELVAEALGYCIAFAVKTEDFSKQLLEKVASDKQLAVIIVVGDAEDWLQITEVSNALSSARSDVRVFALAPKADKSRIEVRELLDYARSRWVR